MCIESNLFITCPSCDVVYAQVDGNKLVTVEDWKDIIDTSVVGGVAEDPDCGLQLWKDKIVAPAGVYDRIEECPLDMVAGAVEVDVMECACCGTPLAAYANVNGGYGVVSTCYGLIYGELG